MWCASGKDLQSRRLAPKQFTELPQQQQQQLLIDQSWFLRSFQSTSRLQSPTLGSYCCWESLLLIHPSNTHTLPRHNNNNPPGLAETTDDDSTRQVSMTATDDAHPNKCCTVVADVVVDGVLHASQLNRQPAPTDRFMQFHSRGLSAFILFYFFFFLLNLLLPHWSKPNYCCI